MPLTRHHYETFRQEIFSFQTLKKEKTPEEITALKKLFKETWEDFKSWQLAAFQQTKLPFVKPKVESWTNGWKLRTHFWCPYRSVDHVTKAPCLAVMLNEKNFRVYLMYQHYKSENSTLRPETYNALLAELPTFVKNWQSLDGYYLWTSQDSEWEDYLPLKTYLKDEKTQKEFQAQLNNNVTFQLGYLVEAPEEVEDVVSLITQYLEIFYPLYNDLFIISQ